MKTITTTAPFLICSCVVLSYTTQAFLSSSSSSRVKSSHIPRILKQVYQQSNNNDVSNNNFTELYASRRTLTTKVIDTTTSPDETKKNNAISSNDDFFDTSNEQGMNDLIPFLRNTKNEIPSASVNIVDDDDGTPTTFDPQSVLVVAAPILFVSAILGIASTLGYTPNDVYHFGQQLISNPQDSMSQVIESVKEMGPIGLLYYGLLYVIAELLAIPATPLTLSAGYLFGMTGGISVVLTAGAISSCIGFLIGKTLLRNYVEGIVEENPKFQKIDRAVGTEGFKLLLLIRLSPIFPFALVNYLYGASSIGFVPFIGATLLGFVPSTAVYVYTGMVGQALTIGGGDGSQPWYVYAGGLTVLAGVLKLVTDVATGVIDTINEEDEDIPVV